MSAKEDRCSTCGEIYSQPATGSAMFCSNAFHCCRTCKWENGRLIEHCKLHQEKHYYDPVKRAREKQASRDQDAHDLATGAKTPEQLRAENGRFAFPNVKIDFSAIGKKPMDKYKPQADEFKVMAQAAGLKIDEYNYGYSVQVYAEDEKLRYRVMFDKDIIQAGVEESFDRWANSVDFEAKLPKNEDDLRALVSELHRRVKAKEYNAGWAETVFVELPRR